jgi:hypothetical protein
MADDGFYVFASPSDDRVVVHRGTCPRIHERTPEVLAMNWYGPYSSRDDAFAAAHALGVDSIAGCRVCKP